MIRDSYIAELLRENFWEHFVKELKADVNKLGNPRYHPLVANSFSRLKDNLGDKENKTLEKFIDGWRKQGADYERRLTAEAQHLSDFYKRHLKHADSMLGEEYINLMDGRELINILADELEGISPEKAKEFRDGLEALDKELKEKTVLLPKELSDPNKPWYKNRCPRYGEEGYKKYKKGGQK